MSHFFYFEKRRNWRITVLPSLSKQRPFYDVPRLIRNEDDLQKFLDELSRHDKLEYIRQHPYAKCVQLLINVTFYINKINEHSIGASVPLLDYFLKIHGMVALIIGSHGSNNDDLCLFRCLAVNRGAPVRYVESPAKTDVHQYLQHTQKSTNKF